MLCSRNSASPQEKVNSSYCEWQMSLKTLSERGKYVLQKAEWYDCKFIIGTEENQEFKAHKLFLAMSSPVFAAMFFGELAEGSDPISIPDVEPSTFEAMLEYIYTDAINFQSFDHACSVYYAAKKYMLTHLLDECMNYLNKKLSPRNACRGYEIAEIFEEQLFKEKCLKIIRTQTESVLRDESFEEVELATLTMILQQEELAIRSELVLFEAIQRWAREECIRKGLSPDDRMSLRSVLGAALHSIRFCTLTPAQFAAGPAVSPLLTQEESFNILLNISNPSSATCKAPMPEGFSTSTEQRAANAAGRTRFSYECESVQQCDKFLPKDWTGSVCFMADMDIELHGVQISKRMLDFRFGKSNSAFYKEEMCVCVLNSNGSVLVRQPLTSLLRCDGLPADIMFSNPVAVRATCGVVINITLCQGGVYRVAQLQQHKLARSHPVNFSYRTRTITPIIGIIFTVKWYKRQ